MTYEDGWARLLAMPVPARPMSLDEIAAVVGCHKNNIWIIEQRALRKLRGSALREWLEGEEGSSTERR